MNILSNPVLRLARRVYDEVGDECSGFADDEITEIICDAHRMEQLAKTDAERAALAEFRRLPWREQCRVVESVL